MIDFSVICNVYLNEMISIQVKPKPALRKSKEQEKKSEDSDEEEETEEEEEDSEEDVSNKKVCGFVGINYLALMRSSSCAVSGDVSDHGDHSFVVCICRQLDVFGWSSKPFVLTIDAFYSLPPSSFLSFDLSIYFLENVTVFALSLS